MRKQCKYCGKQYDGDPGSSCCPDCAAKIKAALAKRNTAEWEKAHRQQRNNYHRDLRKQKQGGR